MQPGKKGAGLAILDSQYPLLMKHQIGEVLWNIHSSLEANVMFNKGY